MKLTPLLILMLVFLLSGVMCLFSTQDVYAQNNAKREFKFHQENIRSKKRNNDLQKARQRKGRSDKSKSNNLRIRLLNHLKPDTKSNSGLKEGYYYEENDSVGFYGLEIIYNRLGLSRSTYTRFYDFYYPERSLFHQWYEKYRIDSINISYMFGDEFTFTIGRSISLLNGKAEKWNWNEDGSGYIHSSTDYSGNINFITLGFKISLIEFLIDLRDVHEVVFKNFECSSGNCGDHEMFRNEPMQLKNKLNIGLGFVF